MARFNPTNAFDGQQATRTPSPMPAQQTNPLVGGLYGSQGLTSLQNSDLYGGMGFGKSTWQGDNPLASIINQRLAPGVAWNVLQQQGFQNENLPAKLNMIRNLIRNVSPGNNQAIVDKARRQLSSQYAEGARQSNVAMGESGVGSGMQQGALLDAQNRANDRAGTMAVDLASPQGQMEALSAALQALGMASPDIATLLGINQPMETSRQYRNNIKGQGSVLNGVTGLLGQAASSFLPGGGGSGGGSSPNLGWTSQLGLLGF